DVHAVEIADEDLPDRRVWNVDRPKGDAGRLQPAPGPVIVVDAEGEVIERRLSRRLLGFAQLHQMHDRPVAGIEPGPAEREVRTPALAQPEHVAEEGAGLFQAAGADID